MLSSEQVVYKIDACMYVSYKIMLNRPKNKKTEQLISRSWGNSLSTVLALVYESKCRSLYLMRGLELFR